MKIVVEFNKGAQIQYDVDGFKKLLLTNNEFDYVKFYDGDVLSEFPKFFTSRFIEFNNIKEISTDLDLNFDMAYLHILDCGLNSNINLSGKKNNIFMRNVKLGEKFQINKENKVFNFGHGGDICFRDVNGLHGNIDVSDFEKVAFENTNLDKTKKIFLNGFKSSEELKSMGLINFPKDKLPLKSNEMFSVDQEIFYLKTKEIALLKEIELLNSKYDKVKLRLKKISKEK